MHEIYEEETHEESIKIPEKVNEILQFSSHSWFFNMFDFDMVTQNEPMKYITHYLFNHYDLLRKFVISPQVLNNFITTMETGYKRNNNPYHNNLHGADVAQTLNVILCETHLIEWLTDIEILACLLAALMHDYDHTGRTNGFHIATSSDLALKYNDRSVQENHHVSASFLIFKDNKSNILSHLTRDQYHYLRGLIIDLVLSTDMGFHFQVVREVKISIESNVKLSKTKALALALHAADVSSSLKKYPLNVKWINLLMEEFFAQGDCERDLNMPITVLCDRENTLIPESQLNFMDFVVKPTYSNLNSMAEFISQTREESEKRVFRKPWVECFAENRKKWQEAIRTEHSPGTLQKQRGASI